MKRLAHIRVTAMPTAINKEELRAFAVSERALRTAMKLMPWNTEANALKNIRARMKEWLRNIRYSRQQPALPTKFKIQHVKEPAAAAVYVPVYMDDRKKALLAVRNYLRDTRRMRATQLNPPPEEIDDENQRPYFPNRRIGIHRTAGLFLVAQKLRRAREVFNPKRPRNTAESYVGVEIEFICGSSRQRLATDLNDAELAKHVHLHGDGSVEAHEEHSGVPMEISVLATQSEIKTVIPKLTAILHKHKSYVNGSCGLHVHIDMRQRDAARSFKQLVRAQSTLYAMVPASRKSSQYCAPTKGPELRDHGSTGRYHGINPRSLNEHNTLEVRMHSGTLSNKKILNWIDLLLLIVDGPELEYAPRSPSSLCRKLGATDKLKEYVLERVAKFNTTPEYAPGHLDPIDETPDLEIAA